MKVTKRILREMIEAEINLLNEATERTGFLNIRGAQRTIEKLGKLLRKYLAAEEGSNQQDRRRQRFLRLWNAISGGVVKDDLEIDGNKTELGNVVDEAREAGLISQEETTNIDNDLTASGRSDPDPTRTQQQMAAAIEELEVEEEEETEEETEASSSDSVAAQEGGETELSDESTAMLTTMKTQGGILKRGSSGSKVGLLQDALRARLGTMSHQWLGAAGQSDNDFGGKTEDAVEEIQNKYGITKDGVVGPNTAASLLADAAATGTAPARRRPAPSAGDEPAAQEDSDQEGNTAPDGYETFNWSENIQAWYNSSPHSYRGESYSLWIHKDGVDYHTNDQLSSIELSDFTSQANESKSLSERLGMILSEATLVRGDGTTEEGDTLSSDLEGTSEEAEAEEAEEEAPEAESGGEEEASDEENSELISELQSVLELDEIKALLEIIDLRIISNNQWGIPSQTGSWTNEDLAIGLTNLTDSDIDEKINAIQSRFRSKVERLINWDFSVSFIGGGGNFGDGQKRQFLASIEPLKDVTKQNLLSKGDLTMFMDANDIAYSDGRVDDAWNSFSRGDTGTTGNRDAARMDAGFVLQAGVNDDGVPKEKHFSFFGLDDVFTAVKALAKMKDVSVTRQEVQSESLSYDRFSKLAGILLD